MNEHVNRTSSCSDVARRPRGHSRSSTTNSCDRRCRGALMSFPLLRFAVLFLVLAPVVKPVIFGHRQASAGSDRGPPKGPPRYHNRRLIDGRLEAWQVARCRQREHYVACFLCGKIVQSTEVYYGCCRMQQIVLQFCDQLLA